MVWQLIIYLYLINSASHTSTSSIIHESDVEIDIDCHLQVCTTSVERHNVYIVPCSSMAATDCEPHDSAQLSPPDVTVTYQV